VKIIRDQLDIARVILQETEKRRLTSDEQSVVLQLARELVELTDAVRSLLTH
jgi:hypothetical protein